MYVKANHTHTQTHTTSQNPCVGKTAAETIAHL